MTKENVKTRTKIKRRLKLKGVLLLVSIFLVLYLIVQAGLQVKVSSVIVSGNDYLKDAEVIKLSGFINETKYFEFRQKEVCDTIMQNPIVSTCKINRHLDLKVEIEITENIPLFYYTTDAKVVLSNGTRIDSSNVYGVPTLINLTTEHVLEEFISGLSEVKGDIIRSISEIEYAPSISQTGVYIDEERFVLSMTDGNTVIINNRHLDVLNHYDTIYASLGDKKGTLNFDCDFGNYPFTEYGE